MPTLATKDGVEIFYKDWGKGQPHVLREFNESKQVIPNKEHPDGYELDFAIPLGMSGAPLVIRAESGPQLIIVGVCVGRRPLSHRVVVNILLIVAKPIEQQIFNAQTKF